MKIEVHPEHLPSTPTIFLKKTMKISPYYCLWIQQGSQQNKLEANRLMREHEETKWIKISSASTNIETLMEFLKSLLMIRKSDSYDKLSIASLHHAYAYTTFARSSSIRTLLLLIACFVQLPLLVGDEESDRQYHNILK